MIRVRFRFVRDAISCASAVRRGHSGVARPPVAVVHRVSEAVSFFLLPAGSNEVPRRDLGSGGGNNGRPSPKLSSPSVVVKVVQKPQQPSLSSHVKLIGAVRAMNDYCLKAEDLNVLPRQVRRSPYIGEPPCVMYLASDVRSLAIKIHGSAEALQKLQNRRRTIDKARQLSVLLGINPAMASYVKERQYEREAEEVEAQHGAGHVVLTAVCVNAANCALKFVLWIYTGSHSLFAECVHSFADTLNQVCTLCAFLPFVINVN
ncbi:unnamed protein product [Soboliphyme baturini]|uniref:Zinc transporter 1 n=1 Tax=Soboliphyme baturini TaxID=241478 RepID=A0A183ITD7_9BILA|nr:unnamed protein product [Soboliphyme baturini]